MFRIFKLAIVILLSDNFRGMVSEARGFVEYGVMPDVISNVPPSALEVIYSSGAIAKEGNELNSTQTKDIPSVKWNANPNIFHCLSMIDPDVPSREEPTLRQWQHWLVGNIPGDKVWDGEILTSYAGPNPLPGTGLHRYVFLVHEQPSKLNFDEQKLIGIFGVNRGLFSISDFAKKYKLGEPISGNFFQAQYHGW